MQNAARVHRGEPGADAADHVDRGLLGKCTAGANMRRQIQTVDVLHREEEMSVGIADIVNAADVGMGDLPRYAYLIVKLGEAMRIGRECGREKLQRDRMAEPQILGLIDDTHAAASELPDDPIAARQRRAVGQCRVPEVREVHSRDRRSRSGGAQRFHRGKRLAGVGRRQTCRLDVEERSAAERAEAASLWSRRITGRTAHTGDYRWRTETRSAPLNRSRQA